MWEQHKSKYIHVDLPGKTNRSGSQRSGVVYEKMDEEAHGTSVGTHIRRRRRKIMV